MNQSVRDAVICEYAKVLKMPALRREYAALARQARQEQWEYEDFLRDLLENEVRSRRERAAARRMREARFPDLKTLDQIDWAALKGVSRPKIMELAACEYLESGDDICIAGPIGTGKTHLAIALGI